ncbi:hypothetical protein SCHPADRAFT_892608 [Schizopora paradoxa]|uniref:Uncharacterized protein n=1 Tax=Schizopora paradoxa TaxID=27342 RepID=A0A0H2RKU3_9AGAM|nr:hypothetical protein SCHPADRAFT_892608 [Schizopora paradoxa]
MSAINTDPNLSREQRIAEIKSAHASPSQLQKASREQLVYIANLINVAEGSKHNKPVIKKSGKVGELRQRIADYFSIILPSTAQPISASASLDNTAVQSSPTAGKDAEIRKGQWENLRALGRAEMEALKEGKVMLLGDREDNMVTETALAQKRLAEMELLGQQVLPKELAGDHSGGALMQHGRQLSGDEHTLVPNTSIVTSPPPYSPLSFPSSLSMSPTRPTPAVHFPAFTQPTAASSSLAASILADMDMKISRLKSIQNIKDAIEQVENGEVQAIREEIGPKAGRGTNPQWKSIKNVVNRREKLFSIYKEDFDKNMQAFLDYFSKPAPKSGQKRKVQATETEDKVLNSFSEVTQTLIPAMEKAIKAEREKDNYLVDGVFSEEVWDEKWSGKNRFKIWDILKATD